jgi:hypothetical protein
MAYGVALLVLAVVAGAAIALPVVRGRTARSPRVSPAAAAVYRHTRRWQLIGLLVGVPLAIVVGEIPLGRGLMMAAPVFGLCVLAGVLVGEATAPRLVLGDTRAAVLEVRHLKDYLPTRLAVVVAALAAGLTAILIVATVTAGSDDLGRAGRALTATCGGGIARATPWPGSYYSIPMAMLLLAGLTVAAIAFRQVTGRPRPGTDEEIRAVDDYMRRRAGRRIVAACGVLVAVPTVGVALVSSATLRSVSCGSAWATGAEWGLIGIALLSLGLLGWFTSDLAETVTGPA